MLVPTEVHVALSTDRLQFLEMLESQLKKTDRRLTRDEGLGLIQLIAELAQERIDQKKMLNLVESKINDIIRHGKGLQTQGYKMLAILNGEDPDTCDIKGEE